MILRGGKVVHKSRAFWCLGNLDVALIGGLVERSSVHTNAPIDAFKSDAVPNPQAVRYAWEDNPICNPYNKESLPAAPFRTDKW